MCIYTCKWIDIQGFLGGSNGKKNMPQWRKPGFYPWVRNIPWRREWLPTPVFLPREFHGQRNLVWLQSMGSRLNYIYIYVNIYIYMKEDNFQQILSVFLGNNAYILTHQLSVSCWRIELCLINDCEFANKNTPFSTPPTERNHVGGHGWSLLTELSY